MRVYEGGIIKKRDMWRMNEDKDTLSKNFGEIKKGGR